MHLLFARHGQSTANTLAVFANCQDDTHPLTARGERHAHDLARRLQTEPISQIYTSPLLRARQTAAVIATVRNLPLQVAPALREYDVGTFEGEEYGGEHAWRMNAYHQNEAHWRDGDPDHRLGGGESLAELHVRLDRFVRDLRARHTSPDTILLVGHGGLFRVALSGLLENVTMAFSHQHPIDYGTLIRATMVNGRLHCTQWGDHHIGGELPLPQE